MAHDLRIDRVHACALALAMLALTSSPARAHIRLLEPASWVDESALGDPQKQGPCGTADAMPAEANGNVTTYQAGETITVRWQEAIAHSGHFRIALARDRSELADPDLQVDAQCNYAAGAVSETPEYPVLLDNLYPRATVSGPEMFEQQVTLPDMTCDHCTLQVIQFMTNHSQPCIYYHCADVRIVAADGSTGAADAGVSAEPDAGGDTSGAGAGGAGAGGAGGVSGAGPLTGVTGGTQAGTSGGAGGATTGAAGVAGGATGTPPAGGAAPSSSGSSDDGCAVGGRGSGVEALLLVGVLLALRRRRLTPPRPPARRAR